MTFKRLEVGIFFRLIFISVLLYAAVYYFTQRAYPQVVFAGGILIGLVWELARYVTRSNNELAKFIMAVKYRDFSQQFNEKHTNPSLRQLHHAFNQINNTFKQLQFEKEAQFHYLQTILQLIDTGIISFDAVTGEVEWINEAFKRTLGLPYLKQIHALEKRNEALHEAIVKLKPNESQLVKLKVNQQPMQLLLSATAFKMQQRDLLLVAFKNVSTAIDETETEAWQKLLRVMTHELMNSVAPISSLADTMRRHLRLNREQYEQEQVPQPNGDLLQDIEEGIEIIQNRGEGLLRFAKTYRNLSKVNDLLLTTVYVEELLNSIYTLMNPQLEEKGILLVTEINTLDLTLQADPRLLEQVLINLILNAQRAVLGRPNPTIKLVAGKQENEKIYIDVTDNGSGIPEEIIESIFIPFFTAHKDGSGIGLSLAKQIMHLHKGNIQVKSKENLGTTFTLQF
ncbi:sensor histidine kinase [Adhaeribacter radiodurans]|uniref:histidine kinase n=1 Tax=Adhaeribacter radiodurans TaxID=2745197 RepID=A0A7L7LEX9_9BACT|nr:HAMP domain-containing sensor histidine kinase [Adhaeribacter radiodurans]QMU31380.1 PAS domain-containing sensor histidine kinase [Adhaeribacter radiodurans]